MLLIRKPILVFINIILISFVLFCFGSDVLAETPPPPKITKNFDIYFGTKVYDPYRWMESDSKTLKSWMKSQNDYTRKILDRLSIRQKLLEQIRDLDNSRTEVTDLQIVPEKKFYFKTTPEDNDRKLYTRSSNSQGSEKLVVDISRLMPERKRFSIDFFKPSPDGQFIAIGISSGGSENSVLYFIEIGSGRKLPEFIERVDEAMISWLPDSTGLFYNQLKKLGKGSSQDKRFKESRSYLHKLGTSVSRDIPVLGSKLSKFTQFDEDGIPGIIATTGSPYLVGFVAHGTQNELTIYAVSLKQLNSSNIPWRKIADISDEVTAFKVNSNKIFLLSHKSASRFKVLELDLDQPNISQRLVIPPSKRVITNISASSEALYVQQLDGGISRILRVPYNGKPEELLIPLQGSVSELVSDTSSPGVTFQIAGWVTPPIYLAYDPSTKEIHDTGLYEPSSLDLSKYESKEIVVPGKDGTPIPLSIISKRGISLNSHNPTILYGYGAYGISINPTFEPTRLAWLDNGGIFAIAHIRGGGEYGDDWHKAGQKKNKRNTVNDYLDCAQFLINQKYTSHLFLAAVGASAGGITIGSAITRNPEIFAAALIRVGTSDMLRAETEPNGPPNIPEFGSTKTASDFKALLEISPYHHIFPGTAYPAVILSTGFNDQRVSPWQSAKMAARLQSASSSGKPILLNVDFDAGHGFGSTKSQYHQFLADDYAFLLWQFGLDK